MTVAEGSPPLARGTAAATWAARITIRITPACAGNSMAVATHRGRGRGSPPLARGTATSDGNVFIDCGITPACAGNRLCYFFRGHVAEDHPRLRGEQDSAAAIMRTALGSPPLARGTGGSYLLLFGSQGITPACAGNSYPSLKCGYAHWDHPRLRGEQLSRGLSEPQGRGSPPLARGTGRTARLTRGRAGITPACAGNSLLIPARTDTA